MINWKKFDSVIFETLNLDRIREFYEVLLQLKIARYRKNGREIEDATDRYVNYRIGNSLIGFELGKKVDTDSIVLLVSNLSETQKILKEKLTLKRSKSFFISFSDPDGREIIIEQDKRD